MEIDQDKLMEFLHRFVGDLGATMAAGNVLVGGVIGMGVDAYNGAAYDHDPNPVAVTLVPDALPSAERVRRRRGKPEV